MFPADSEMTAAVRLSRAEAYMALKQYCLALEDTEFCHGSICSAEVSHSLMLQQCDQPYITYTQTSNFSRAGISSLFTFCTLGKLTVKCNYTHVHTHPFTYQCSVQSVGGDILE